MECSIAVSRHGTICLDCSQNSRCHLKHEALRQKMQTDVNVRQTGMLIGNVTIQVGV